MLVSTLGDYYRHVVPIGIRHGVANGWFSLNRFAALLTNVRLSLRSLSAHNFLTLPFLALIFQQSLLSVPLKYCLRWCLSPYYQSMVAPITRCHCSVRRTGRQSGLQRRTESRESLGHLEIGHRSPVTSELSNQPVPPFLRIQPADNRDTHLAKANLIAAAGDATLQATACARAKFSKQPKSRCAMIKPSIHLNGAAAESLVGQCITSSQLRSKPSLPCDSCPIPSRRWKLRDCSPQMIPRMLPKLPN